MFELVGSDGVSDNATVEKIEMPSAEIKQQWVTELEKLTNGQSRSVSLQPQEQINIGVYFPSLFTTLANSNRSEEDR